MKSDDRSQPISDGQQHCLPIFKIERQVWSSPNLGCAAVAVVPSKHGICASFYTAVNADASSICAFLSIRDTWMLVAAIILHEPPVPIAMLIASATGVPLAYMYCEDDKVAELILAMHKLKPGARDRKVANFWGW